MSFYKNLVVILGILTIIPGTTIKAVHANTTTKNLDNVGPECINYMITSGGETICLDSESPVELEPAAAEPSVGLDCSPETTAEVEPPSEPVAEVASSAESTAEGESSSDSDGAEETETTSESESTAAEPASEPATAEGASPELLADAECSPDSSVEDLETSP
ncbi:MAG: hypothetical protein KTR27_01350 [Leptolyngbyaceae cyanobacterium MAG.088]|nr:hypothetical protein [Leptolyngbyaceae cyanobacterium MAG.088]